MVQFLPLCPNRIYQSPCAGDPSIFIAPSGLGWGYLYASTRGRCAPDKIQRISLGGFDIDQYVDQWPPFGAVRGLARAPNAATGKFFLPGAPSQALPREEKSPRLPPGRGAKKKTPAYRKLKKALRNANAHGQRKQRCLRPQSSYSLAPTSQQ